MTAAARGPTPRRMVLVVAFVLAVVGASIAEIRPTEPVRSVFDLGFGFGPRIARVAAGSDLGSAFL